MTNASLEIVPCPRQLRAEALSLVLCEVAPSQRREIAGALLDPQNTTSSSGIGLFVALRGDRLCGAVWAQPQPGHTAVLWPPQLVAGEEVRTAFRLAESAVHWLDRAEIGMAQVLLPSADDPIMAVLKSVEFHHLADLLYLSCEAERLPTDQPEGEELEFVAYDASQRGRLADVIDRTYAGTLDCPALNGARHMGDVLDGYQSTGVFRAQNWLLVRHRSRDVGVLLLTDHPSARHWELVYMGLVPEARGRGWGRQITQHAQVLARRAEVERIVLAVDAANAPALAMYCATGFEIWDRRTVFVRFSAKADA